MFIRNCWYAGAWSGELPEGGLVARRICDEPIVFLRTNDGIAALEDRCRHRGLPLSLGSVQGDTVQCRYHGLRFARDGACVRIPGQSRIPPAAAVRAYPVVEQDALVWVWTGDPESANNAPPPRFPWHIRPGWAWRPSLNTVGANFQLFNDNLLDLSHVGYVHSATLGGNVEDHSAAKLDVQRSADSVRVVRVMRNTVPGPFHVRAGGFTGRVDRYQIVEFTPGLIVIDSGMTEAGKLSPDCSVADGAFNLNKVGFNGLTPETEHSTHYFWSMAHAFGAGDAAAEDAVFDDIKRTFDEDVVILEAQYARRPDRTDAPAIDADFDVAGLQARRIVERRIAAERALAERALVLT